MEDTAVVIVAAGRGERAGGGLPKQWRMIAGKSSVDHAASAFREAGIERIVVVLDDEFRNQGQDPHIEYVQGGGSRSESVRLGLEALDKDAAPGFVLIHDAARPLISPNLIENVQTALAKHDGAAPGMAISDSLWRGGAFVEDLQSREGLFCPQTPQGFRFGAILRAHRGSAGPATDDV